MALVRILIDGYSLLHHAAGIAPGRPRHSEAARDELLRLLTRYQDAVGTPITVFFDGSLPRRERPVGAPTRGLEVLYSHAGQTADQMIERVTHRLRPYGEVLVVTNDRAERDLVISLGAMASSCEEFVRSVAAVLHELDRDIEHLNLRERSRFQKAH